MDRNNRSAAFDLFDAGTRVQFKIEKIDVLEALDPSGLSVHIHLCFPPNAQTTISDLEWGALGFLFVIGILSFSDAGAGGPSIGAYDADDRFWIDDLHKGLRWQGQCIRFSVDDVRGRQMNTTVVLQSNGTGTLSTVGRDMAAQRWLHCLQGKAGLQLVPKDDAGHEAVE